MVLPWVSFALGVCLLARRLNPMTSEEWRSMKAQFGIKTGERGRTSSRVKGPKHKEIRLEGVLADLRGRQTHPQRGHTYTYACATKISVLLRYGSDG